MRQRITRIVALLAALALGGVIGHAVRAHGGAGAWADVRTWGDIWPVIVGVPAALYQLSLQRVQLREQQKVIEEDAKRGKRRDELLDGQLHEFAQRAAAKEREQADRVAFSWEGARALTADPADADPSGHVWMAVVANGSNRPIRDVVCRIQPGPEQDFEWGASAYLEILETRIGSGAPILVHSQPKLGDRVPLIRVGEKFGLKTSIRSKGTGLPG